MQVTMAEKKSLSVSSNDAKPQECDPFFWLDQSGSLNNIFIIFETKKHKYYLNPTKKNMEPPTIQ